MKRGSVLALAILLLTLPFWAGFAMESHGTANAQACPLAPQAACPPNAGVLETFLFHAGHVRGLTLGILTLVAFFALASSVLARNTVPALSVSVPHARRRFFASTPLSAFSRKFARWLTLGERSPSFA